MQLSITCFYLTASIVADRYVITGARTSSLSIIFGWIFINAWYMECLVQIVMAVNRFICDKDVMSFMFINIEGLYSYSNLMLVSYDVFCTSTSTLCYISVFRSIRKSYKTAPSNVQKKRANDDVKYLTQFVFISIFFIFTWVLFELLPYIVPKDQPEWFSVVPVLVTLNCSSNSIIYLSMNKHVQQSLQIPWLRNKLGYSLGILEDFGVPNIIQTTAVFLFLIYVLISILAIFENRFHVVCNFRWKVKWTLVRRYWLGIHYFVGLVVLIPFFFLVPDQREARIAVLKQLPCLPDYITNAPLFITSDDYTYHVTSLALFLVIGITESVIFILLLVSNTIQQLRAKKMSQKLFEIQKKFFIALVIQMLVPSIFLLIPLWYAVFSILFGYYNQAAINISVTMESIHGLVSTLVMIFIHRPYREAFFDIFGRSLVMKDDQNRSNIKVVPGLHFLHKSFLRLHGKFRSATCLVNDSWQVKLAEFGLEFLQDEEERPTQKRLLCASPEVLRGSLTVSQMDPNADVYSFAIVA
ncbi:hypothetical protein L3Y34_006719 [Caenorhabditis briggsae]|uniref:Protein kinase domain-containing protein n=1 Tax=Caenorhabditis briggsae TaxID=6238 RepID=A0AAE9CY81_CAEBR|nr:hypothetical protein L3Y34_006719 [Caenorhabditis briggsae]